MVLVQMDLLEQMVVLQYLVQSLQQVEVEEADIEVLEELEDLAEDVD